MVSKNKYPLSIQEPQNHSTNRQVSVSNDLLLAMNSPIPTRLFSSFVAFLYQSVYICNMKIVNRNSKSENTKQFIIEKVAPIFNKKGYSGTSLSDLTNATKLTKGSIYGNFKNKDEVALESFNYNLSIIVNSFKSEISLKKSSIKKLLAIPKVYRSIYEKVIEMGGCPILNTATDADDTHSGLRKLAHKALLNLKKSIESIIAEGINKDEIKPDVNPDMIAGIFLSLIEGGFLVSKLTDNRKYFENSLLQIEHIINEIRI